MKAIIQKQLVLQKKKKKNKSFNWRKTCSQCKLSPKIESFIIGMVNFVVKETLWYKTKKKILKKIKKQNKELHSYDVPEIIELDITKLVKNI